MALVKIALLCMFQTIGLISCVKVATKARASNAQRRSLNVALCNRELSVEEGTQFGLNLDALGPEARAYVCEDRLAPSGGILYISQLLTTQEAEKLTKREVAEFRKNHGSINKKRSYYSTLETDFLGLAHRTKHLRREEVASNGSRAQSLHAWRTGTSLLQSHDMSRAEVMQASHMGNLRVVVNRSWEKTHQTQTGMKNDKGKSLARREQTKSDNDKVFQLYGTRLQAFTGLKQPRHVQVTYTFPGAPVQPFHHDRNGAKHRYLTVLTYLQAPDAGGGTVFPTVGELDALGRGVQSVMPKYGTRWDKIHKSMLHFSEGDPVRSVQNACTELSGAEKDLIPPKRFGIQPVPGDAVVFFHFNREHGASEVEARASPGSLLIPEWNHFHAGCEVPQDSETSSPNNYDPDRAKIAVQFFAEVEQP